MIQTTASQLPVTIVNISASGARLIALDAPPSRQDVQLVVSGLSLFGRIVWRRDKAFALRFEDGSHNYTPEQIYDAVERANNRKYEFNRNIMLADLMNKEKIECECKTDATREA